MLSFVSFYDYGTVEERCREVFCIWVCSSVSECVHLVVKTSIAETKTKTLALETKTKTKIGVPRPRPRLQM